MIAAVERFVAAFNSGSEGALRAAISPLAQWYSVTLPGSHEVAYGQADMIRHVGMRHAAGDRLERPRIAVNALVGWDGGAHFGVTSIELRRGNATFELHGKGALYCDGSGRGINVISLGA